MTRQITPEEDVAVELPAPTTDIEQAKRDIDQFGVGILRDFCSAADCGLLIERLQEQAEMEREQGVAQVSEQGLSDCLLGGTTVPPPFQMVNFLPNKGRLFRELMCHPSIMEFARHIFRGVPFYLASQNGVILRNGATEQILHVDQQAWPFLTPIPVTFVAVLALTDFEPEMGSTYFAPATHHRPPPRIGIDASGAVVTQESVATRAVSAPAGSLLVWEGRVWHGQGASRSDRDRLSVIQGYSMHMVRPQDDFAASIHDGVYEQLTDEQKRVLGFNVEFEYTGRIGPRNADDRRRNLNFHFPYVPELRRDSAARAIMRGDMRIDHVARQAELIAQPGTPA